MFKVYADVTKHFVSSSVYFNKCFYFPNNIIQHIILFVNTVFKFFEKILVDIGVKYDKILLERIFRRKIWTLSMPLP